MTNLFEELITKYRESASKLKRKTSLLSWLRTLLFIVVVGSLIYYFNSNISEILIFTIVTCAVFYYTVIKYRQFDIEKNLQEALVLINEDEVKRAKHQLKDFESGESFIQEDHPYQVDLDIFGNHSIYQLINRCEIDDSKSLLAIWLSNQANEKTIRNRQESVKELSKKINWRQEFQAKNMLTIANKKKHEPTVSAQDILDWVSQKNAFNHPKTWKIFASILGAASLIATYFIVLEGVMYQIIYPILVLNGIFLMLGIRHLNTLTKGIDKSHYIISSYGQALEMIEKEPFQTSHLINLQNQLKDQRYTATQSIGQLSKLTHRLSSRANMLYGILDVVLLMDIHLLVDFFNWKKKHLGDIENWLSVVNKMECLVSLSGFAFANPNYNFPEFETASFYFDTVKLGHPLISGIEKVRNDYRIAAKGNVDIITGSNMSGKSTFQRTVGVNMVLAQCGAPVDAESLKMSPTHIFTSMRTKDNLEEHTSSFYAELKRISKLLEATEKQSATFFILDEILKGTNSEDRHKGSIALAKKLSKRNTFGMISTHDLGLGQLAETEKWARNFSFNSEIEGDKIIFDYRLTEGICKSFNASKLMENMGILDKDD
ncbi:MAG: DNA mismatch repair ATPase MutS [Cyclobacteriaceae bacterium]|jgi:DNA mismatch repair ATPase MutS